MSFFNKEIYNVVIILIIVGVIWLIYNYNNNKVWNETLTGSMGNVYSDVQPSSPNSFEDQPEKVNFNPEDNKNKKGYNYVNDLLPSTVNNEWSQFNPNLTGEVDNINKFKAGALYGIDTVGSSMRNANQQIRSEPPNPIVQTGPWNQSTITPDFVHVPFEIGVGTQ